MILWGCQNGSWQRDRGLWGLKDLLVFLVVFYKLEVPDDLQDGFCKIGSFIFLVLLDYGYKSRVFRPDIHQYCGLKVNFSTLSNIEQCFSYETSNIFEHCLIATDKFVYILEV